MNISAKTFLPALLPAFFAFAAGLPAQPTVSVSPDSATYLIRFPYQTNVSILKFSPRYPGLCRLNDFVFDPRSMAVLPEPIPIGLSPWDYRWVSDPSNPNLCWTYSQDGLCRHDLRSGRTDTLTVPPLSDFLLSPDGIWGYDARNLYLIDPKSGALLRRIDAPEGVSLYDLHEWGSDFVNPKWRYRTATARWEPFEPVPGELEGCVFPKDASFLGKFCLSNGVYQNSKTYFLSNPDAPTRMLPFHPQWLQWLGSDDTHLWFRSYERMWEYAIESRDTLSYPLSKYANLTADASNGRFCCFWVEQGLIIFDKQGCRFTYSARPYGSDYPRAASSDKQYLYLSFEDHWEILDPVRLPTAFPVSEILSGYEDFQKEYQVQYQQQENSFYPMYDWIVPFYEKYHALENPKIEDSWPAIFQNLAWRLNQAPDSIAERAIADFEAGRFLPAAVPDLAMGLFYYYGKTGAIDKALALKDLISSRLEESDYGEYLLGILQNTKRRLDSLEANPGPPDRQLYARGLILSEYCHEKIGFRRDGEGFKQQDYEQADEVFRTLIRQYPDSPFADNAAYEMFHLADYLPVTTDDETPPADFNLAYRRFRAFLNDYPDSDRRPDVLLRLARVIDYGAYHENHQKEEAIECLQTIALEYPDFAAHSIAYQKQKDRLDNSVWTRQWALDVATDKERYGSPDSIRVTVRLTNISRRTLTLDSLFLSNWTEGMQLWISRESGPDCEYIAGYFRLRPEQRPSALRWTVLPGEFYEIKAGLASTVTRTATGQEFPLKVGSIYQYFMEYGHPTLKWLRMEARKHGKFVIE